MADRPDRACRDPALPDPRSPELHNAAALTARLPGKASPGVLASVPQTESTPPLYCLVAWARIGVRSVSALAARPWCPWPTREQRHVSPRGTRRREPHVRSSLLIWYSQEARAYALLGLLGRLSFLFFVRASSGRLGRSCCGRWPSALSVASLSPSSETMILAGAIVLPCLPRASGPPSDGAWCRCRRLQRTGPSWASRARVTRIAYFLDIPPPGRTAASGPRGGAGRHQAIRLAPCTIA
jgi:hypothetical protein